MNAQTEKPVTPKGKSKLTAVSTLHYIKLVYRSLLLLAALGVYLYHRIAGTGMELTDEYILLGIIGLVYAVEMILRFFPSKLESPGCQKVFKKNYIPTEKTDPKLRTGVGTALVLGSWLALNGTLAALYLCGILDAGIMILIGLAYGVCDMICILFFCPFQTLMMKNRCCATCRIYNWDFAMMCTPFILIPHPFTWGLSALSLGLLARWEITFRMHPERFSAETNACISCRRCTEKLCAHKKQLRSYLKKYNQARKNQNG